MGSHASMAIRFRSNQPLIPPFPPGCALCHRIDTDLIPDLFIGPGGRSQRGLGPLCLVRVSAITHAWVHDQCARWSPEVHELEDGEVVVSVLLCPRGGRPKCTSSKTGRSW